MKYTICGCLLCAKELGRHVRVGHRVEAAGAADEVVLIGSHARVAEHTRQVATGNVASSDRE